MGRFSHLVRFEQSNAQQQWQGNLSFHRVKNSSVVLHLSQLLLHVLEAFRGDKVHLVQQQNVPINHLSSTHLRLQHCLIEVLCINKSDDRIKPCLLPQFTAEKGHGHRQGISEPGGFNHDVVEFSRT